ncbi:MAG TPA: outer membrane beta-barrel protein [Bacteroidia bacterium]|jgi:hypothetical protein|nr:outer membrane beta-barrel protein [Bacteroidia bacterium]
MKRILFTCLLPATLFFSHSSSAQCIERGTSILELSARLGDYNDATHFHLTSSSASATLKSAIYALSYEITPFKWLGVGLQLRYDQYIDSATLKQNAYSLNVPIFFNIHIIHTTHINLYAGMAYGFTSLSYNSNDISQTKYSGIGSLYDIHAGLRFFLSDHFGISIPVSYTNFSYPNLDLSNPHVSISNWADKTVSGLNIGLGLNYKF